MAKKVSSKTDLENPAAARSAKPSTLLDTRVIYCGDNLEQPGRRQKEEGRMMKPAPLPILPSSFIQHATPTELVCFGPIPPEYARFVLGPPTTPLSQAHRRGQLLQSEAVNGKNAPEGAIRAVRRKR